MEKQSDMKKRLVITFIEFRVSVKVSAIKCLFVCSFERHETYIFLNKYIHEVNVEQISTLEPHEVVSLAQWR